MRSRQTILSPLLRSLAAFALVVFVVAQALCFVHCHYGGGRGDNAQPSCHSSPQHAASHDGNDDSGITEKSTTAIASTKTMKALMTTMVMKMMTTKAMAVMKTVR